jgi:hypothetical protein
MAQLGFPGGRLSLAAWLNLLRFVGESPLSVGELTIQSLMEQTQIKHMFGCLERWGFVWVGTPRSVSEASLIAPMQARHGLRDGWGSGRGINSHTTTQFTPMGMKAREVWEPLPNAVEDRWRKRFGNEAASDLRQALEAIQSQFSSSSRTASWTSDGGAVPFRRSPGNRPGTCRSRHFFLNCCLSLQSSLSPGRTRRSPCVRIRFES